jgi:MtN3 and saliva related transmembrane protein
MDPKLIDAVGVAAAACSMASFVPQVIKIWREKHAGSVSLRMYVVTVTGFSLWIAYGLLLGSWPLVGSNLVCLCLAAMILLHMLRYGGAERKRAAEVSPRGPPITSSTADQQL